VVLNDDGKPHAVSFEAGPVPPPSAAAPSREPSEGGSAAGYAVACALAGDSVFCADRTGAVHRVNRDGGGDRVVASSRTGSRIGAAPLAGKHAALAYLASRKTSEGWVSEAWLAVDDEAPVRLSEDGSGATAVMLAARGASVLAVSVDARTALTALHVRPLTFEGHVQFGEDVVVFVGGPGERYTMPAVSLPDAGGSWALLPIAKDVATFGLAQVRIDQPPRVEEPVVWSMYPNGLDPAPVAAAARGDATWVARVRPESAEPGSSRVVEVGVVAADGTFGARHVVPASGKPTDVSLTADAHGGLWLAWLDASGSWVERIACK
jgi:hypothetical protein